MYMTTLLLSRRNATAERGRDDQDMAVRAQIQNAVREARRATLRAHDNAGLMHTHLNTSLSLKMIFPCTTISLID
jgi:hypothetical protein